ncbi:Outer membrane protein beta-barrel domain-containing protein [Terriglobus roseus]|uniref:Outer membrane protein beta-barrel domain-containing protein n=1 Tax=Terriglobus roseus TaxID=392734 RepID=A0A1H4QE71_9BACT|nr:Outer membrane protein beta-barrel domain-containing protein [Terriglobus roseus]
MLKRYASLLAILPALLASSPLALHAQDTTAAQTRAQRVLSHFDIGVSGIAFFTKDVSGTVASSSYGKNYNFTQSASSAAGVIATIRGQKSPWKGFEVNYGYGRTTESYTCCNVSSTTGAYIGPFQSQATASEYTAGYLVRPDTKIFGFQPYVAVGAGVYEFKPTLNGGQGLQTQARAAYYYSVGAEDMISPSFGIRAGFRQLYYKAPDFGQNYLKITKTTFTSEPMVGVFYHF